MSRLSWFVCGVVLLAASGCGGSDSPSSPSATPPRGEFAQIDLVVGTGATASTGRSLNVRYTGWLYDPTRVESKGTQFDSGTYAFTLGSGNAIQGWHLGLVGMRVGGQRRLIIPPELAYGSQGRQPSIPSNASLVFDTELLSVQ
jgi:FKBP-type peptidyl-prolyl cis-trans isomerase FkpA